MFTGIVEEKGIVKSISSHGKASVLVIHARTVLEEVKTGDSINTNGVCLTVKAHTADTFTADVMPETMKRSSLGQLKTGSPVNLERAVRLSDRLGGHIVNGHVDGTGRIERITRDENAVRFRISVEPRLLKYIVEKGSVAIDGISLTVTGVESPAFEVSVIPHTQDITTLQEKNANDIVNIECDIIGKYIEKMMQHGEEKIDKNFLAEHGFM